jgi:Protein of unknown function (DUF3179)
VLSLTLGGETRAYPVQVLIFHEIVNDTVGGVPVAVTYCALCNSGIAFDRRVAGRVVTFGASGKLLYSNLVMYDRQARSLSPQLAGLAVAAVLTGTRLTAYPVQTVAWQDWLAGNPHAWVLSKPTAYDRSYGFKPLRRLRPARLPALQTSTAPPTRDCRRRRASSPSPAANRLRSPSKR